MQGARQLWARWAAGNRPVDIDVKYAPAAGLHGAVINARAPVATASSSHVPLRMNERQERAIRGGKTAKGCGAAFRVRVLWATAPVRRARNAHPRERHAAKWQCERKRWQEAVARGAHDWHHNS
ncbi:MAG: hypothetical protein ACPIOQ_39785 [Promethearchaeia archaeon]